MPDSSVLNEAARVLKLVQTGVPADAALRETLGRTRHLSAPRLRREVTRAVFAHVRWWRWLEPKHSLQKQAEAALELQARFDRVPESFKPEGLAARAAPKWTLDEIAWPEAAENITEAVRSEVATPSTPQPTTPEDKRPYPTELACLRQMQREPALWLRAKKDHTASVMRSLGDCSAPDLSTFGVPHSAFIYSGHRDLFLTHEFRHGLFEIQDLASQLVGFACAPQPGQVWWDACAGEGGKTLHLSDLMQNKGLIWASDRSRRRLEHLKKRAARAHMFNYRAEFWNGPVKLPTKTKFDGVLVDAPCSGIGTWQRNPHARWTTSPNDVQELATVQSNLLKHVAPSLKSGARLVYSVCTLTRAETLDVVEKFSTEHHDFEPVPVFPSSALRPQSSIFLWPHELNANGMFIATWRKK